MGIHRGPNTVKDGLVFGYDTGYGVADNNTGTRFYPGKPTTNHGPVSFGSWGTEASAERIATGNYYNGQPTYNCRTVVGQSWRGIDTTISGLRTSAGSSGTVTVSCMVRNNNGSAYPMYAYIGHDFSSTRTIAANSDWQRIQWTVNQSSMGNDYVEFRPYTNNASIYLEMTMPQVEDNVGTATPWTETSRSSTASLIDLKKTTDIDVSNVSFDSTGQPTFDGSDDYISIDVDSWIRSVNSVTIEGVVIIPSGVSLSGGPWTILTDHSTNSEKDGFWWHMSLGGGYTYFRVEDAVSGEQGITFSGATPFASGNTYHIVTIVGLNSVKIYVNGVLSKSYTPTFNWANVSASHTASLFIGRTFPGYWLNSTNPVVKVYDVALTEAEIKQNYNAYKNRFDI